MQRLPTEDDQSQREVPAALKKCLLHAEEEAGRRVQHRDLLVNEQAGERLRRARRPERSDDEPRSVKEGPPELPHREVECIRMEEEPGVIGTESEPFVGRREEARNVPMLDLHALRLPGRTRGVDDVGEVLRLRERSLWPR